MYTERERERERGRGRGREELREATGMRIRKQEQTFQLKEIKPN